MTLQDGIFQCNLSVRSKVYSYKLLFGLSLPCFAPHSEPGAGNMCLPPTCIYSVCAFVCYVLSAQVSVCSCRSTEVVLRLHLACAFMCVCSALACLRLYVHVWMSCDVCVVCVLPCNSSCVYMRVCVCFRYKASV